MREQIARAAGFNRVSWKERRGAGGPRGGEKEGEGDNNEENATSAREERETEIIVEITYELRAEETGGERDRGRRMGGCGTQSSFPRDFLIIYRARGTYLSLLILTSFITRVRAGIRRQCEL